MLSFIPLPRRWAVLRSTAAAGNSCGRVRYSTKGPIGAIYLARLDLTPSQLDSISDESLSRKLGSVKIGFVKGGGLDNAQARMRTLQTGGPIKIDLHRLLHCDDPSLYEKYWHTVYKDQKVLGEWYALSESDIDWVCRIMRHCHERGEFIGDKKLLEKIRRDREKRPVASRKIVINDDTEAKTPSRRAVQQILHKHVAFLKDLTLHGFQRSYLNADQVEKVLLALEHHPEAEEKIGVGVKSVFVARTSYEDSYCFHVKRYDGSEEDFSYIYCFGRDNNRKSHYTHKRGPHLTE